jgi:hypothetical protein
MRKIMILLTLSVSFLAATANATQVAPPDCGNGCPWVKVAPPDCGNGCPWVK